MSRATCRGRHILVAGIGNIFFGDDGFGVEVVRRLAALPVPDGVTVADFGIRGLHLAYEMLDGAYDRVIFVDALRHDAAPGTIAVIHAQLDDEASDDRGPGWDAHTMDPVAVLRMVRQIGGSAPDVVVVGCQPARIDDGIGLSPAVEAAVGEAAGVVLELVSEQEPAGVPRDSRTDRRTQP